MALGSQADYSPANLAKSMEFFHFFLNGRLPGGSFGQCDMTFFYDTVIGIHEEGSDPHQRVVSRRHPTCSQSLTIRDIKFL